MQKTHLAQNVVCSNKEKNNRHWLKKIIEDVENTKVDAVKHALKWVLMDNRWQRKENDIVVSRREALNKVAIMAFFTKTVIRVF